MPQFLLDSSHNRAWVSLMGLDEESVFVELNPTLTAHEKLELRLSMPREFWLDAWKA